MTSKQRREEIKRLLSMMDNGHITVFKRMYAHGDMDKDINLVVDEMPRAKLQWALQQCETSYYKLFAILSREY